MSYFSSDGPSDAALLLERFSAEGKAAKDITAADLGDFYQTRTTPTKDRLDLGAAVPFLPAPQDLPHTTDLTGLIIETRPHPNLVFIVTLVSRLLGCPIHLVHGPDNRDFILNSPLAALIDDGRLYLTCLPDGRLNARSYNGLMLSPAFWHSVLGRGPILLFQTDAILCEKSAFTINDFLDCDYIGSAWRRRRPVGLVIDGGNGGLSLRNWPAIMDCLERFPPENWQGAEDEYFGFHTELAGWRVGKGEKPAQFSSEEQFFCKSFGGHQITNLRWLNRLRFMAYCPASRRLFSLRDILPRPRKITKRLRKLLRPGPNRS